jgi:acyl-CoA synthetase (NDP forming)
MVLHEKLALEMTEAGIPVLDGTREALLAIRHALQFRDFRLTPAVPVAAKAASDKAALDLLADYGIRTTARRVVQTRDAALEAANALGYPVVLKTAEPHIAHKTEVGGVRLNLRDAAAVAAAYDDVAARLGPLMAIERMAPTGVEIAIGAVNDPQFGPYVMVAAGGVLIELLTDRAVALSPIDALTARRLIEGLKVHRLLAGWRGAPAADIDALADCVARLSLLAAEHSDSIAEIDVNPVIVHPEGCIAVDALIVSKC